MTKPTLVERIEATLREAGIHVQVGGCGCCGSPWLAYEIDGETHYIDDAKIDSRPVAGRTAQEDE